MLFTLSATRYLCSCRLSQEESHGQLLTCLTFAIFLWRQEYMLRRHKYVSSLASTKHAVAIGLKLKTCLKAVMKKIYCRLFSVSLLRVCLHSNNGFRHSRNLCSSTQHQKTSKAQKNCLISFKSNVLCKFMPKKLKF